MTAKNKKTPPASKPAYTRVETGGLDELRGLITGIKACVHVAQQHYGIDKIDCVGLAELVERADFVLAELQSEKRTVGAQ